MVISCLCRSRQHSSICIMSTCLGAEKTLPTEKQLVIMFVIQKSKHWNKCKYIFSNVELVFIRLGM